MFGSTRILAVVIMVGLMLAGAASAHAQIEKCPCEKVPLFVEEGVGCAVTFAYTYPNAPQDYQVTVKPGQTVNIECREGLEISILTCGGTWVPLVVGGCVFNLNAGPDPVCCVDACLELNKEGCWAVLVRPTIVAAPTCPCRK